VKKVCFVAILPLIMMIVIASCSSASKSQKTDSVAPEVSESEAPPPVAEPVPEIPEEVVEADTPEEIADTEDTVDEEPALAEEEPPAEVVEPEPPVVTVVPEPEPPKPAEPPPPPVTPAPRPEPPRVTTPPPATARPTPPPPPPAAPPVEEEKPPVKEEPPVIVQEPPPRNIPELPYPTPGISGKQEINPITFSRVVRATVGQLVEVPFRGTGWVYLGETNARRGIIYDSRRLEPEGQSFIFRTERAGEYALKFYRQDFIRDFIINDYVQVIVGAPAETAGTGWFSPPADRSRVIAEPRWPSALAEAQALRADSRPAQPNAPTAASPAAGSTADAPASAAPTQPSTSPPAETPQPQIASPTAEPTIPAATQSATPAVTRPTTPPTTPTATQPTTPAATPPTVSPDASKNTASEPPVYTDPAEYLKKAQEEFAAGRVASAISFLDQYCEYYPSGTDETWWLYGQFYEANSPSRNILAALNCYRRLVQEYPQSSRFDDARKRIAYLQRYYININ
jgi:hypothetical protein